MFPTLLRRVALVALLAGGPIALFSVPAEAAPSLCKKKKAKKKKAAGEVAEAKITSKTIKAWQVEGLSDDEIIERCNQAGYQPNAKGIKGMKKAKVRPSIIAALTGNTPAPAAEEEVAAKPEPKRIDISKTIDPSEIDFDSVAPPAGTPAAAAFAKKPAAKEAPKVAEKKAEEPKATFIPKPQATAAADAPKPKRVVYTAAN
jgi:hypothetical protein